MYMVKREKAPQAKIFAIWLILIPKIALKREKRPPKNPPGEKSHPRWRADRYPLLMHLYTKQFYYHSMQSSTGRLRYFHSQV